MFCQVRFEKRNPVRTPLMNPIAARLNSAQLSLPMGLSADYPANSRVEYDLFYRGITYITSALSGAMGVLVT